MVSVFYIIAIEAIICGFMLNRTLYSKTSVMWHMPIYVLLKTIVCTYAVHIHLTLYVTPLCILFSAVYAFICFRDSTLRKTAVIVCGMICLGISNLFKLSVLGMLGLTQDFDTTRDVLSTVSIICFSLLIFSLLSIIFTNILCRVRLYIVGGILLVHLLLLVFTALIYLYMHSLIAVEYNALYSVFALFLLLPAVGTLYFSESIAFARKDNYFSK